MGIGAFGLVQKVLSAEAKALGGPKTMATSLFSGIYYELLRAWPNRWLGFFVAAILASALAVVVIALPDQYESSSRLYINSEVVLKPLLQGLTVQSDDDNKEKMLRVLQTTLLSQDNIDRLIQTPGLGFDASTPSARSKAARSIRSGMVVNKEDGSDDAADQFTLNYLDTNPVRARNVVQGLLSIFIESNIGQAQKDMQEARKFLDTQIAEYEVKLRESETRLNAFRLDNTELLGTTTHQARLTTALATLRDAELARQVAVSARDRVKARIETQNGSATPVLLATDQTFPAAIDRLGALQAQLNQLLLQYTDNHPDVVSTRREITLLTEQYGLGKNLGQVTKPFAALPGQVSVAPAIGAAGATATQTATATQLDQSGGKLQTAAITTEPSAIRMQFMQASFAVMDAERRVLAAREAVKVIDQQSTSAPAAEAMLDQITRDYTVLKENYDQLIRRRESARMTQAADLSSGTEQFRIIQTPSIASEPTAPDRKTLLLVGAFLATFAGAALAYGLGLLRGTFVTAAEAEQALGLPVIARLTNTQGVLSRVSSSADALLLMAGTAGIFFAAFVLSSSTGIFAPFRTEIYRFIETNISPLVGHVL